MLEEVVALFVEHESHGVEVLFTFTDFFNDGQLCGAELDVVTTVIQEEDRDPEDGEDDTHSQVKVVVEEEVQSTKGVEDGFPPVEEVKHESCDDDRGSDESSPNASNVYRGKEDDTDEDDQVCESEPWCGVDFERDSFLACDCDNGAFSGDVGDQSKDIADQPQWPVVEQLAVAIKTNNAVLIATGHGFCGGFLFHQGLW